MTVREYLETYGVHDNTEIKVIGSYKYGLTDLYKGNVKKLLEIYRIVDILERKNWGGLDKNKCFLVLRGTCTVTFRDASRTMARTDN